MNQTIDNNPINEESNIGNLLECGHNLLKQSKYSEAVTFYLKALEYSNKKRPQVKHEMLESLYHTGLCMYKLELLQEANYYFDLSQRVDHTYLESFEIVSELKPLIKILETYEYKKNDPWFLLAAFKIFRKSGHIKYKSKFLNELKERFPNILESDLMKLDMEICDCIDNYKNNPDKLSSFSKKIQEMNIHWHTKNEFAGCVFMFHELYYTKKEFDRSISR